MSKRKEREPAGGAKAAGKQRVGDADGELENDDQLAMEGLLAEVGEDTIDDAGDLADVIDELPEEDGDDGDGDEGQAADAAGGPFDEVGELPDGLTEQQLTSGEEVDLSAYELTLPQARRVAQCLARNESIATVKFEGHSLAVGELRDEDELEWDSEEYTDVDAIVIGELLRNNSTVSRLDLARNQIGDAGACALAAMLGVNSTVEYLNLESNTFGERGTRARRRRHLEMSFFSSESAFFTRARAAARSRAWPAAPRSLPARLATPSQVAPRSARICAATPRCNTSTSCTIRCRRGSRP